MLLASSVFGYTGGNGMIYCRVAGRPTPPQQIRTVTAQKHLNINLMLGEDEYASSPVGTLDMHLSTRDLGGCSTISRWQSKPPSALPVRGMISVPPMASDMSSGCIWYWGMSTTHPSGVRLRPGSASPTGKLDLLLGHVVTCQNSRSLGAEHEVALCRDHATHLSNVSSTKNRCPL